jgi:Cysteine-rich secretory protein family
MRCLLVVSVAILLAAAGLIRVDSPAEAAGGGNVSRCGGGEIFLYPMEMRLLTLHNNARKNHGLKPFCVHPALQEAARAHAKDMIEYDYYAHGTWGGTKARARESVASVTPGPTAERTSDTTLLRKACSSPGCVVTYTVVTYWMGGSAK